MAFSMAACGSSENESTEPKLADDHAMTTIAEGLSKRFKIVNAEEEDETDEQAKARIKEGVQAELDTDTPLKNEQFENTKMQEKVLAYLNVLQESMDVLKNYSYESTEYIDEWNKVYDKRTEILKTFVDDYGLKMTNSEDQATLDELVANGASAAKSRNEKETIEKLISSLKFEEKEVEYSDNYFTYTAIGENTSDITFENVAIVLSLYDADGVKKEAYSSINIWEPGEKVKFEAMGDVDAKEIKATVQSYNVAD